MTRELLGMSSVSPNSPNSATTTIPIPVLEALGDPDRVAWFIDQESGLVYVIPRTEVTIR